MLTTTLTLEAEEADKAISLRSHGAIHDSTGMILILLETDLVKKEIRLTDSQRDKLAPLKQELASGIDKAFEQHLAPEERNTKIEQAVTALDEKCRKKLEVILSPTQLDRVWEIMIQLEAFQRGYPDLNVALAKVLELSDDQKRRLDTISLDAELARDKMIDPREIPDSHKSAQPMTRDEMRKRVRIAEAIYAKAREQSLGVLTARQRDRFARMNGKDVDRPGLWEQIADSMAAKTVAKP